MHKNNDDVFFFRFVLQASVEKLNMKIIWSFWEGPSSSLNDECLQSWRKNGKGWEVRILNDAAFQKYVHDYNMVVPTTYDTLSATTKSDVVRLNVLYTFGGLWLDRTVLLNKPLDDWILPYERLSYFGFRLPLKRYVESWFILVPEPRNQYIKKWRDTLVDILQTNPVTNHVAYSSFGVCTELSSYFMIYQAFCYCVSSDAAFRDVYKSIPFIQKLHFYSPFHPLHSQPGVLTKFTKHGRVVYDSLPFPCMYGIILCTVLIVLLVTMLCVKKTKKSV